MRCMVFPGSKRITVFISCQPRTKVELNGMFSDCEIVNHGVPQGTVLGPLIFLLYVNDFSSNTNTTEKVIQFADDTSIFCCRQKVAYMEKSWKFYKTQNM